jgi:hypothetical protein
VAINHDIYNIEVDINKLENKGGLISRIKIIFLNKRLIELENKRAFYNELLYQTYKTE